MLDSWPVSDLRYFVEPENPSTFQQAVKTQMVEQLLASATADRFIHPAPTRDLFQAAIGKRGLVRGIIKIQRPLQ
ncbi:unnamed protein product [Strongylus vulgaris]|uniref:Uncharacterized protein n=1 Tax=Strongylus vulgaris TaxID=40348 RepID=A0A3P7LEA5_STRVU|nr:unnamed protein product [Strongylus vulgaris]